MGSVRMIVYPTKECCCCILANELDQHMRTTRVFVNKAADIMNKAGDEDEMAFL